MDEIVLRGMVKWPNVPSVYGWLALDRRGQWLIKGERIGNPIVSGFINRNYAHDDEGRWYFQNGPQRVFVELAYTPLVYRIQPIDTAAPQLALQTHTGAAVATVTGAWLDQEGTLLLATEHGPGLVDDRDLEYLPQFLNDASGKVLQEDEAIEIMQASDRSLCLQHSSELIAIEHIDSRSVAQRFGFNPKPVPPAGVEACY